MWEFDGNPLVLPGCELYDANRPLIAEHSSFAQFWVSWNAVEPKEINTDYEKHMSGQLRTIEHAVDLCVERGVKVEFVMWHTPSWASVSGKGGASRPKMDYMLNSLPGLPNISKAE